MKIECPNCHLTGNINDATIPVTGLAMNCPRCKTGFQVERQAGGAITAGATTNTCPSCQYSTYSEEMFSTCPQCGLVIADHYRQVAEQRSREEKSRMAEKIRQQDEKARQKYGLDESPKAEERVDEVKASVPLPVQLVGWAVVAVGVLLLLYAGKGVLTYLAQIGAAQEALQAGDEAPGGVALFFRYGLVPILFLPYAGALLAIGMQFLQLQLWTIRALTVAAWTGVGLAALQEVTDLVAWFHRASDVATIGYYVTGVFSFLLMLALWIAPQLLLINYLRSREFDQVADFFN